MGWKDNGQLNTQRAAAALANLEKPNDVAGERELAVA
jgi:hypothetical protein